MGYWKRFDGAANVKETKKFIQDQARRLKKTPLIKRKGFLLHELAAKETNKQKIVK